MAPSGITSSPQAPRPEPLSPDARAADTPGTSAGRAMVISGSSKIMKRKYGTSFPPVPCVPVPPRRAHANRSGATRLTGVSDRPVVPRYGAGLLAHRFPLLLARFHALPRLIQFRRGVEVSRVLDQCVAIGHAGYEVGHSASVSRFIAVDEPVPPFVRQDAGVVSETAEQIIHHAFRIFHDARDPRMPVHVG